MRGKSIRYFKIFLWTHSLPIAGFFDSVWRWWQVVSFHFLKKVFCLSFTRRLLTWLARWSPSFSFPGSRSRRWSERVTGSEAGGKMNREEVCGSHKGGQGRRDTRRWESRGTLWELKEGWSWCPRSEQVTQRRPWAEGKEDPGRAGEEGGVRRGTGRWSLTWRMSISFSDSFWLFLSRLFQGRNGSPWWSTKVFQQLKKSEQEQER